MSWRPKEGWFNPFQYPENSYKKPENELEESAITLARLVPKAYEAGADAMFEALFKLAKESPTGTFTIDSRCINIYEVKDV